MFHKLLTFSLLVPICSWQLSAPVLAETSNVAQLCEKFPKNSRCLDIQPPKTLKGLSGQKAKCLDSQTSKMLKCLVNWTPTSLLVFSETGEKLKALNGRRATRTYRIPYSSINALAYSESSKVNTGAVLAFGLWGLLSRIKRSSLSIRYADKVVEDQGEPFDTSPNQDVLASDDSTDSTVIELKPIKGSFNPQKHNSEERLVMVIKRKDGRALINRLERKTGKKSDLLKSL